MYVRGTPGGAERVSTIASGALRMPRLASSDPTGKYVSKSASSPARFERHSPVSGS